MKYFLPFMYSFLSFSFLQAQESIIIRGEVLNQNGKTIANANVYAPNYGFGTASNNKGHFIMKLPREHCFIHVSHLGFQKKKVDLLLANEKRDTLYFQIVLEPEIEKLKEIDLVDNNDIERAYQPKHIRILDFEFYRDGFLLLLHENHNYKLRYIDANETTLFDIPIEKGALSIEKDCYGIFYLSYRETMYQLLDDTESPSLKKAYTTEVYQQRIAPCKISSQKYVYLSHYEQHNQQLYYYQWDLEKQEKKLFANLFDLGAFANAQGEIEKIKRLKILARKNPRLIRKIEACQGFYDHILSKPLYEPLLSYRDEQMVLCKHTVDSMLVYNRDGHIQDHFPISYHKLKGWKEVLMDYNGKYMYAKCLRDGMAYLFEIDMETGQVISETRLEKHTFPNELKIRDRVAYYLYKKDGYYTETNLYRQELNVFK